MENIEQIISKYLCHPLGQTLFTWRNPSEPYCRAAFTDVAIVEPHPARSTLPARCQDLSPASARPDCAVPVLNANYVRALVKDFIPTPYDETCRHEFVASAQDLKRETGVEALDIAKALLDRGYHAPTIYFPLLVPECLMIEPTETESKETLDAFVAALREIVETAKSDPQAILDAPVNTVVGRIDETRAARQPDLRWVPAAT